MTCFILYWWPFEKKAQSSKQPTWTKWWWSATAVYHPVPGSPLFSLCFWQMSKQMLPTLQTLGGVRIFFLSRARAEYDELSHRLKTFHPLQQIQGRACPPYSMWIGCSSTTFKSRNTKGTACLSVLDNTTSIFWVWLSSLRTIYKGMSCPLCRPCL